MMLAIPLVLALALTLSSCNVSVRDNASRDTERVHSENLPGASGGPEVVVSDQRADSDQPVKQNGESDDSFNERRSQYNDVKKDSNFSYNCDGGSWSSTGDYTVVLLRGHCTDVNITHSYVQIWVPHADRVNVGTGGSRAQIIANQIGDITITDHRAVVYTGSLGDVTVAPKDVADYAKVYTGTIGQQVTIQADYAKIRYDEGNPSVTATGRGADVTQN